MRILKFSQGRRSVEIPDLKNKEFIHTGTLIENLKMSIDREIREKNPFFDSIDWGDDYNHPKEIAIQAIGRSQYRSSDGKVVVNVHWAAEAGQWYGDPANKPLDFRVAATHTEFHGIAKRKNSASRAHLAIQDIIEWEVAAKKELPQTASELKNFKSR